MIFSMLNDDEKRESIIILVIERENLERMRRADPATLESPQRGGIMQTPKYPEQLSILVAYEGDDAELYRRIRAENLAELLRWLERGRQFDPERDGKENAFTVRTMR